MKGRLTCLNTFILPQNASGAVPCCRRCSFWSGSSQASPWPRCSLRAAPPFLPMPTAVPPPPATDSAETSTDKVVETAYLSRSELAAPVLETADALTEARVLLELDQLAFYFEAGCYWNHYGIDVSSMSDLEQAMCVTDSACAHSENGYDFCNIYNGAMSEAFPEYDYETQCLGYASLISDLLFGTDAPVTEFYDFDDLRIGDHIRLVQNEHSMIVTDIDWSTDTITVTEVNADYENCQISWGRTITRDELYSMEGEATFYTRYTA